MKLKKIMAIILMVIMLLSVAAVSASAAKVGVIPKHFTKGIGPETDGYSIDYRYFSPVKEDDTTKYPLVIWLHGMGDGEFEGKQVAASDIVKWTYPDFQNRFKDSQGAFIFAPRSLEEYELYWTDSLAYPLRAAIDDFIEKNKDNIDIQRIYIGGYSMGGKMTLKMAVAYPDMFAALFPICPAWIPGADATAYLKDIPVWLTSSASDPLVNYYTYLIPTWENIIAQSNVAKNCRLTTLAMSLNEKGLPTFNGHNAWVCVTNDMFSAKNKPYPATKTQNGFGEKVKLTYPDGMISWLSGFRSDYDGEKATDYGNSHVLKSDGRAKGLKSICVFIKNYFRYVIYALNFTK